MSIHRIVGLFLILLTFDVMPVLPQSQRATNKALEKLWINTPSSPLQFDVAYDAKSVVLGNHSDGMVLRYRIACVSDNNGKIKVISKKSVSGTWLPPAGGGLIAVDSFGILNGNIKDGCDNNLKLMVINVEFEDGGMWKYNQQ